MRFWFTQEILDAGYFKELSPQVRGFLDSINAAALGLMAGVTYTLGRTALTDGWTIGLAVLSAIAVFRFSLNSAWLVLAGGVAGLVLHLTALQ